MNKTILASIITIAFVHFKSNAQNIWLGDIENSVSLEVSKPIFNGEDFYTFTSSTSVFSTNISLNDKLNFYGEIPLVNGKIKDADLNDFLSGSELSIGNIYIGIQTKSANKPIHMEVGIRLPTSKINFKNSDIALLADIDRADAFVTDYFIVPIKAVYLKPLKNDDFLKIRAGLDAWFGQNNLDNEQFFDYSFQYEKRNKNTNIILGIVGSIILSEKDSDLSERVVNSFGGALRITKGSINPGVVFKIPLDNDLNDLLNYSIGVNLTKKF